MSNSAVIAARFVIVQCKRHGLEIWVIFDRMGNEVGSAWSLDGAERRALQLLKKDKVA